MSQVGLSVAQDPWSLPSKRNEEVINCRSGESRNILYPMSDVSDQKRNSEWCTKGPSKFEGI